MKKIYLLRHGRTAYNHLGIWQGSGVDAGLDKTGQAQAKAFYEKYKESEFDLIIHSTLRRTKETVQGFIKDGKEVLVQPDINEISWGLNEGKPHTEASLAEYKRVTRAWSEGQYHVGFKGGESANDLGFRIERFVALLKTLTYNKILICSHGRSIRALLCVMQGHPLSEMEQYSHANTGLFVADETPSGFNFVEYNDTDHLSLLS